MLDLLLFAQTSLERGPAVSSTAAIGWGTLALLNAGLAQSKQSSGLLWWLASLLLGPIATFLLLVFVHPPDPSSTKAAAVDPLI